MIAGLPNGLPLQPTPPSAARLQRRGWQDFIAYDQLGWLAARTLSGEAAVRFKRC